jgi:16S rRNA (cytosine967-C5)-methyltransferase
VNPGRLAAARVLLGVETGAHADDLLESLAPSGRDRGLTWHLVLGVLRRQGSLDHTLAPFSRRPLAKLDPPVRITLRLGAFELLYGRTRAHAAVHQAVDLSRALRAGRAAKFVNAVLRKVASAEAPTDPFLDLPPWLQQRFAEWPEWVGRMAEPAPICGVWRDASEPVPEVAEGPASAGGRTPPGAFKVAAAEGHVVEMDGFADGKWWVMDPASVVVADLLHEAIPEGSTVLDACAAPGGKTLRLATRGHTVHAVDLQPHRLKLVGEGSRRVGVTDRVSTEIHDWLTGPLTDTRSFQGVLVDAPCSALGIVRRHPEIRWRRLASDPSAMAIRQRAILKEAAAHVADDGVLVYSVCSPLPEEGRAVVESLEQFQVVQAWSSAPPVGDEDAFQAFVLRRR